MIFHFGDGPRSGPNRTEGADLVVEEGWVFQTLKPQLPIPPNTGMQSRANSQFVRFGDGVVVRANGARRIGKRKFDTTPLGV